ncbi:MAG: S26 family signal peptidase, partial [Thermoguttaceae bacterium]
WINVDESAPASAEAWSTADQKTYRCDGTDDGRTWLRYQHVIPGQEDWFSLSQGTRVPQVPSRQLISDFTAYNTKRTTRDQFTYPLSGRGVHWVGDLAVECDLSVEGEAGEVVLELVEGGRRFGCALDISSGAATLSIEGDSTLGSPRAETKVRGPGRYKLRFANVDDQLRLWVDGREVEFDSATTYQPLGNFVPTEADLLPAGIASRGVPVEIRRLRLLRDLYYIAYSSDVNAFAQPLADFDLVQTFGMRPTAKDFDQLLSRPEYWSVFNDFRSVEFRLDEGEFLALGDNSGESKDSRLWAMEDGVGPEVPRNLLIGKALFIYWPHSENRVPGTNIPFPFFPNFMRMKVIR